MNRVQGFHSLKNERGCLLSIGNFDGVHLGHQAILAALLKHSRQRNLPSVVMTFEPHPATLLKPTFIPPRLTTPIRKAELICSMGIDTVVEYPTDWALLRLSPREFFDQIILQRLNAAGLVEGPNFFFGKGRSGNTEILGEFCRQAGCFLEVVLPELQAGEVVSSSLIRDAISRGEVERAAVLLGRHYEISGLVSLGAQRGRTIGFPTANLEEILTLIPAEGVYAASAMLNKQTYTAAVSVGPNPTFSDGRLKVEAHLVGATGDFYGQTLTLRFIRRLRGLQKYSSTSELQDQIQKDVAETQASLMNFSPGGIP